MKRKLIVPDYRNKKLYYGVMPLLAIIILTFGVKAIINSINTKENCVMQQTTCCSCAMGGKEECVTESEADRIKSQLAQECREDLVCTAQYLCEEVECKKVDGICKKVNK